MDIYDGFHFQLDEDKDIKKIMDAFESYCIGETNESYERFGFNSRNQQDDESVDKYIAELRKLAKTCNIQELEESLIRDRIIMGVKCNVTRRKLLQEAKLTLSKCIDIARSIESSKKRLQTIQGESSELHRVAHSSQQKKGYRKNPTQQTQPRPKFRKTRHKCKFCGKDHEPDKKKCPAFGKQCTKCKKNNHFAAQCKPKMSVRHVEDDAHVSDESLEFLMAVKGQHQTKKNKLTALLEVGDIPVRFILDTGRPVL